MRRAGENRWDKVWGAEADGRQEVMISVEFKENAVEALRVTGGMGGVMGAESPDGDPVLGGLR